MTRFFQTLASRHLVAGTVICLVTASPSFAVPLSLNPPAPGKIPLVTVQASGSDTETGDAAQREKLRKKLLEEKAKKAGTAGKHGNNTRQPAASENKVKKQGQKGQAASPQPVTPQPLAKPAAKPEITAPARSPQQPAAKNEGAKGTTGQQPLPKTRNTRQGGNEKEGPKPRTVTVPKPETGAPVKQQTESAPAGSRPAKPQEQPGGARKKAAEPGQPAPKTVTVPKRKETRPAQAETGKSAPQAQPGKAGETAAEKLRRDIRERQQRGTGKTLQAPARETATQGEQAPLTDSAKESAGSKFAPPVAPRRKAAGGAGTPQVKPAPQLVITPENTPRTDRAAQAPAIADQKIESVEAESGTVLRSGRRPQRQFDANNVVRRSGNRIVVRLENGRLSVFSTDDRDRRLRRNARNVRVEQLRGGLLRETIYLRDGSRIVTIYSRDGDVLRRSRILPNGYEIVLVYVPRDRWNEFRDPFYDPGYYLPPLIITIPRSDYIYENDMASADDYYRFLSLPPVEPVPRLYSVDEVARSARIRDMARRIDLVSVHFDFGSAEISESEIDELQALAEAMNRLLDKNPGEMFLIEGHTDAVGTEEANLILSDRRAEGVAEALTDYFGIPPENMVTHGYGEQYLKVLTQGPERENRRVAVRRITPLVAPMDEQVLGQP